MSIRNIYDIVLRSIDVCIVRRMSTVSASWKEEARSLVEITEVNISLKETS
jgi:hypothetical protein